VLPDQSTRHRSLRVAMAVALVALTLLSTFPVATGSAVTHSPSQLTPFQGTKANSLNSAGQAASNQGSSIFDAASASLNSSTWTNLTVAGGPSPRYGASMAYDPTAGYVVLFGGFGPGGITDPLNDTWTFSGGVWTNITPKLTASPAARGWASLTYDQADQYLVLTQGANCDPQASTNCSLPWAFTNGSWSRLPNVSASVAELCSSYYGATSVYDSAAGYVLSIPWLLAPDQYGCALSYLDGEWSDLSYNASSNVTTYGPNYWGPALVNDPTLGGVLLFGGFEPPDSGEPTDYTWLFANGTWTNLTGSLPASPPPGTPYGGAAFDPEDGDAVIFIGLASKYTLVYNQTWEYSDGWELLNSNESPSPRESPSVCWDPADNGTLLFGGVSYAASQIYNSTWILSSAPPLAGATISAYPNPVDTGVPAWFSATVWGGTPPFNYSWKLGNGEVSSLANPENTYTLPGNYTVNLTVTDASSHVWLAKLDLVVFSAPVAAIRPSERPADVGEAVDFFPVVSGGTDVYTIVWHFGDGTTSTANAPGHAYLASGNFTVSLWINDSGGGRSSSSLVERIDPALDLPSISASPSSPSLGQLVNFSVSESGGTPPFTYSWNFGDGGTGGNLSKITHIYTTTGPFVALVTVEDAAGGITYGQLNLSIKLQVIAGLSAESQAAPFTVSFVGQVQGGVPPYIYSWSFGDGTSNSSIQDPSHTYAAAGEYTAVLTVVDSQGNRSSNSLSLHLGGTVSPQSNTGGASWYEEALIAAAVAGIAAIAWGIDRGRRQSSRSEGKGWIKELTDESAPAIDPPVR
jgi:PKD repeat protein